MKIFFTASKTGRQSLEDDYQKAIRALTRMGVELESTLQKTYLDKIPGMKEVKDLALNTKDFKYIHDKAVRGAILRCDATVIEATYPSFRLGFEAYYALNNQKPVLVLSKNEDFGDLIDQPHFFGAKYTDFTLPDELEKFIRHVREYKLRNRFNMFISDRQKQQLQDSSEQYGVSMSDYVRRLIDKDSLNR